MADDDTVTLFFVCACLHACMRVCVRARGCVRSLPKRPNGPVSHA